MKSTTKLFLIILSALVVVGCSKKNNPSPSNIAPYAGHWYWVADTAQVYTYPNNEFIENSPEVPVDTTAYMELRSDGTGTYHLSPAISDFTYLLSDNKLIFHNLPYTYNGHSYPSMTDTLLVKKFSVINLIFQSTSIDPPNGGHRYKYVANFYYVKK